MTSTVANHPRKHLRLAQTFFAGVALVILAARSLPPLCYTNKELLGEYLTALALRDRVDVFTPLTDLSALYFPVVNTFFPHPNTHPPVLTLAAVPLTLLPYPVITYLWLALNVAVLVAVGRWLGFSVHGSLALMAWPPVWMVLDMGQWELILLALVLVGWRAADAGRDWRAGACLGLAAVIKLYPALLLLPFMVRRRIGIVLAAGVMLTLGHLGSLLVVGPAGLVRYYLEILPYWARLNTAGFFNSSPYGALLRLFGRAGDVKPLIQMPEIVLPLTLGLSLVAILALAVLRPEAGAVAMLVTLPNVWPNYATLALPQIVALLRRPDLRPTAILAAGATSFAPPVYLLLMLAPVLVSIHWGGYHALTVLTAIQPAGYLGLLLLSAALAAEVKASAGGRVSLA